MGHFTYVTYCNFANIKFGVPKETLETFSVYSLETAKAMALAVKNTANSSIGIGITGQLGRVDPQNPGIKEDRAWYSVNSEEKVFSAEIIFHDGNCSRSQKKDIIIEQIIDDLYYW